MGRTSREKSAALESCVVRGSVPRTQRNPKAETRNLGHINLSGMSRTRQGPKVGQFKAHSLEPARINYIQPSLESPESSPDSSQNPPKNHPNEGKTARKSISTPFRHDLRRTKLSIYPKHPSLSYFFRQSMGIGNQAGKAAVYPHAFLFHGKTTESWESPRVSQSGAYQ